MSLKKLFEKAKASEGISRNSTQVNTRGRISNTPSFLSLDYNIDLITPNILAYRAKIEPILKIIDERINNGEELTDEDKKAFILTFFELAFSQDARHRGVFSPSEISTETVICKRKLYFQKARAPIDATYVPFTSDNRMQRLVDLGTMFHLYVQWNLHRLGTLIDYEIPVVSEKYGIKGKADGAIKFFGEDDFGTFYQDEDMLLEIKTINDRGFTILRGAKTEHIKQASIYASILGYRYICFVYCNKNNSDHKVYVHQVDSSYFNWFCGVAEETINLYNKNVRSKRTTDFMKHDIPQKSCSSITVKMATECKYRDLCFNKCK